MLSTVTVTVVSVVFAVLLAPGGASVVESRRVARQAISVATENGVIEVFNDCKCVYYYQCDNNNYVITSGETLINIRMNENIPRIPCKGGAFPNEIVCCKLNTTTPLKPTLKNPNEDIEVVDHNGTDMARITKKLKCGVPKTIINVRIFAGEDELTPIEGEFPWIAAIFYKKPSTEKYKFHCSGSLIHPRVVLTANHCVHRRKASDFRIIVHGKITLSKMGNNTDEERKVTEIIHHPKYNSGGLFNDAALLILEEAFVASKDNYINTLCLPPTDVNLENTKCLVAGWGKDSEGKSGKIMKKVELPFVNHTHCQTLLRKTRLGEHFDLHKSFMCAGGERGKDACKGDGGSPLMCPSLEEDKFFQVGIVSWGIGCGEENVPGVYGNVQQMAAWIRRELEDRQLSVYFER